MITQADIDQLWEKYDENVDEDRGVFLSEAIAVAEQLLKERNAYRRVAVGQLGDVHLATNCQNNCADSELYAEVDAKAQKLLETKEKQI